MRRRVCEEDGCVTVLSAYNPGPMCWTHATPGTVPFAEPRTTRTSDRFISGLSGTYDLTAEERIDYYRMGR